MGKQGHGARHRVGCGWQRKWAPGAARCSFGLLGGLAVLLQALPLQGMAHGELAALDAAAALGDDRSVPIGSRCASCHQFEGVLSHPVSVTPTMAVPAGLPLEGGRMTCATCHETDQDHPKGGARLREASSGGGLCLECHTGSESQLPHLTGMPAHLSAGSASPGGGGVGGMGRAGGAGLDAESLMCISCHDGTVAGDAGVHADSRLGAGEGEHPLGLLYPGPGERWREVRLVDIPRLDRRIRLFDQTVGCGSCHSIYSPQPAQLVTSNLKSRLCLSCHIE